MESDIECVQWSCDETLIGTAAGDLTAKVLDFTAGKTTFTSKKAKGSGINYTILFILFLTASISLEFFCLLYLDT